MRLDHRSQGYVRNPTVSHPLQERGERPSNGVVPIERELSALREQSLTHIKERVALKSILDDKVRALIGDIGQSLSELPFEVKAPPSMSS